MSDNNQQVRSGVSGLTLVQVSVSGLHCRMSLTMVAFPFSTAQYRAVLFSWKHRRVTHHLYDCNITSLLLINRPDTCHLSSPVL